MSYWNPLQNIYNFYSNSSSFSFIQNLGGPQAMIQSASTYAGFTYMIDAFFGGPKNQKNAEKDFDFKDTPVAVEERGF